MQTWIALALVGSALSANIPELPSWQKDYGLARARAGEVHKPIAMFIGTGSEGWSQVAGLQLLCLVNLSLHGGDLLLNTPRQLDQQRAGISHLDSLAGSNQDRSTQFVFEKADLAVHCGV